MTAFTPDIIRNIARHAGILPTCEIAVRLGLAPSFVERVAREQNIDLRIRIKPSEPPPQLSATSSNNVTRRGTNNRDAHFSVNLREADAKIIRARAEARFTKPSRLLAEVVEGAIVRGKVDELSTASKTYRPVESDAEPQVG